MTEDTNLVAEGGLVNAAWALMAVLHDAQLDHGGQPYSAHPNRVAHALAADGFPEHMVAAALLHDVVEDTETTLADLKAYGFPKRVIDIVRLMTRPKHMDYPTYIARMAADPECMVVKYYDMLDNTDPYRLALVQDNEKRARLVSKYWTGIDCLRMQGVTKHLPARFHDGLRCPYCGGITETDTGDEQFCARCLRGHLEKIER